MSIVDAGTAIRRAAAVSQPEFAAVAREAHPSLLALAAHVAEGFEAYDLERMSAEVAFLAWLVGRAAGDSTEPRVRVEALRRVLAVEEGFRGNVEDYYDPANSFLNRVLSRRLGLPISLSVIYLAVAGRLGWPLMGIDFPSHFLLRYDGPDEPLVIDPFHGGLVVDPARCAELAGSALAETEPVERLAMTRLRLAARATPRRIVTRMLKNLEGVYLQRHDYLPARNVIEKLLLVNPEAADELRDLGGVYHLLGDQDRALECWRSYLAASPGAPDRGYVEAMAARLRDTLDEEAP